MSADSVPVPTRDNQNIKPSGPPLFPLGRIVATPGALALMQDHGIGAVVFLKRHQRGDWATLCADDRAANYRAVKDGSRILSAYEIGGERIWIITEAVGDDRTRDSTCILLPKEY